MCNDRTYFQMNDQMAGKEGGENKGEEETLFVPYFQVKCQEKEVSLADKQAKQFLRRSQREKRSES